MRGSPALQPAPTIGLTQGVDQRRSHYALLMLILGLGALLRLPGLWRFPLEQDELYTVIEATALLASPLNPGIEARPLYYLLQHVMFWFTPDSPAALRILPFVFGMLGIWAVWLLTRRILGPTAAAAAALFTALSPWHMHLSGMARYGSLVFLLAALFLYFFAGALKSERRRDYLAALACLLLGTLTHPTFLFPLAGVALASILLRPDGRLGLQAPSKRAWLHLWAPFLGLLALGFGALGVLGLEGTLRNWDGRGLTATLRLIPAVVEWATPVLFVAGVLGAALGYLAGGGGGVRRWAGLALAAFASTLAAVFAASFVTNVYADYAGAMLPLLFAMAGGLVAAAGASAGTPAPWRPLALTTVVAAGMLPATVSHLSDGTRYDFRPAFATIAESDPELPLLTVPIILQRHYAPQLQARELRYQRSYLDAQLAEFGELWVAAPVQRYGLVYDSQGVGEAWLFEHCRLRAAHQRPRFDYRVYRVNLYRCQADWASQ